MPGAQVFHGVPRLRSPCFCCKFCTRFLVASIHTLGLSDVSSERCPHPTPPVSTQLTLICEFRQGWGVRKQWASYLFWGVSLVKASTPEPEGVGPSVTSQAGSPGCDNNYGSLCLPQSSGCRGEWRAFRLSGAPHSRLGTHTKERTGWVCVELTQI